MYFKKKKKMLNADAQSQRVLRRLQLKRPNHQVTTNRLAITITLTKSSKTSKLQLKSVARHFLAFKINKVSKKSEILQPTLRLQVC